MTFKALQEQSNSRIESGYINYRKTKSGDYIQYNAKLAKVYKQAYEEMSADIAKLYATLSGVHPSERYDFVLKYDRLTKLQKQVQDAYIKASKAAGVQIVNQGKIAMSDAYYADQYALTMAAPNVRADLSFSLLPEKLIEATVLQTPTVWKELSNKAVDKYGDINNYRSRSGKNVTSLLLGNMQKELQAIASAVTQGMIQGKSYQQTAALIRDQVNMGYKNALRISRTEGHRNQEAGHYAMSQRAKSDDLAVRRMIISTLDDRTRAQSARVDGQKENEDGMFKYPNGNYYAMPGNTGIPKYDINDRETTIEVIEGMEPEERTGVDPTTGDRSTFSFKNFDEWAKGNGLKYNRYGELVAS